MLRRRSSITTSGLDDRSLNEIPSSTPTYRCVQCARAKVGLHSRRIDMKKGILLWFLGVPVIGIIALKLFGII